MGASLIGLNLLHEQDGDIVCAVPIGIIRTAVGGGEQLEDIIVRA